MSIVNRTSVLRVIALEINEDGAVSKKQMKIDRDSQLENTLVQADYPDIRVATIDIPQQQLDQYQQAMVEHSLSKRIMYDGVEYSLVGASASAKNGKYYAVDAARQNDRAALSILARSCDDVFRNSRVTVQSVYRDPGCSRRRCKRPRTGHE